MTYYACSPQDEPEHTIFLVGQNACGHYLVQENHGLIGGEFICRADAIRFAREESTRIPGAVVLVAPPLIDRHA